jgi:DNA-directed RNA polymerase specialized sigma24 family protein
MDHPPRPADEPSENGWADARFLELARNGGQGEAYRLLLAHSTRLRGYLSSRYLTQLGGTDGVEEIVHEAAWKAIESASTYQPGRGGVLFWVWRIGVNHALDRIRSDEARRARERAVARPEQREVEELLRFVCEAIARLPEPFRTVLQSDLEQGEGCSGELAKEFEVGIQTVYNWRLKAHALIAPLLGPLFQ